MSTDLLLALVTAAVLLLALLGWSLCRTAAIADRRLVFDWERERAFEPLPAVLWFPSVDGYLAGTEIVSSRLRERYPGAF